MIEVYDMVADQAFPYRYLDVEQGNDVLKKHITRLGYLLSFAERQESLVADRIFIGVERAIVTTLKDQVAQDHFNSLADDILETLGKHWWLMRYHVRQQMVNRSLNRELEEELAALVPANDWASIMFSLIIEKTWALCYRDLEEVVTLQYSQVIDSVLETYHG